MALSVPAGVAAGAVGAGAAAGGLFKYNRENFMFDQGLRFNRFCAGYSMAIEQGSQYREDVADMTALTTTKEARLHVICGIMFTCSIQLIMAGRLGVHGPSPSGWQLAVYWCLTAFAFQWLVITTWLSLHAHARSQSGMVHLRTRSVRLPIPTPHQLDKARSFGIRYETQRVGDILRVPFLTPAPHEAPIEVSDEDDGGKAPSASAAKPSRKRRAQRITWSTPVWAADEDPDLYTGAGAISGTPEHFEMYRGLMHEWWAHDVYARITLMITFVHWLQGCALYIQCHAFTELRALWVGWSCTIPFCFAVFCVLQMDIMKMQTNFMSNFPVENFIPYTPLLTCLGMSIDYSVISANWGWRTIIYLLSWICYILHFLWAIRLYDLAQPHSLPARAELPGKPWWPQEWYLPSAFMNVLYLVAPPKQLEPGQTCLLQEMKAARGHKAAVAPTKKERIVKPQLFPWKIVRGGLICNIAVWAFVMVGRVVEQVNGERQLLKQEGRVERWPAHMQPWMPPWTREGKRDEWNHAGGSDRRLQIDDTVRGQDLADVAEHLLPVLRSLADALEQPLFDPDQFVKG
eukprot:CAMPEP_0178448616 /NCGR_PEP_ID=MMETSP0689_2-20121128/42087_1 /TAXON_ID=160604 /ORGANISM="Amphidinium massartii, Strain CS-259" /LENGTH=573 /DNA_ID=CAMNT_0020073829 /DNA_START=56 /DNA_END=1774 /DNA_ORIENTATION=-